MEVYKSWKYGNEKIKENIRGKKSRPKKTKKECQELPLEINTSIIYYLKEFLVLSETQVLWDQINSSTSPQSLFFFLFTIVFIRTTFPRIANGSQFVIFGPFSFTSDIELNIRPSAFLPEVSPRTHCTPFSFMLTWPPASRFSQVHLSVSVYPTCRRGRMCLHSCWSTAPLLLSHVLIFSSTC